MTNEQWTMSNLQPPTSNFQTLISDFQERIGWQFRNLGLLLRALTHTSYVNEHPEEGLDNQRLEFLGDAVLGLAVADWLFQHYPEFQEGEMTRLRAALVCERSLADLAAQIGLGEVLRLGRGEAESGGRERPGILADAFEALMAALYLDGGLEPVHRLVERLVGPAAEAVLSAEADRDAKSRFQEWAQGTLGITPRYRIVAELGPEHARRFIAEVLLGEKVAGRGEGPSKQVAEHAAAQDALQHLEDNTNG
jgi:ribonuclease-3